MNGGSNTLRSRSPCAMLVATRRRSGVSMRSSKLVCAKLRNTRLALASTTSKLTNSKFRFRDLEPLNLRSDVSMSFYRLPISRLTSTRAALASMKSKLISSVLRSPSLGALMSSCSPAISRLTSGSLSTADLRPRSPSTALLKSKFVTMSLASIS